MASLHSLGSSPAEAERAAAEDNRGLSGLIIKLLRDHLKGRKS
jgi:hypothetical protein